MNLTYQWLHDTVRARFDSDEAMEAFLPQALAPDELRRKGNDVAFAAVRGGRSIPRGILTVTAPVMFGRFHLLPVVVELSQRYPDLQVRPLLLDRVADLVDERVDIVVRIADDAAPVLPISLLFQSGRKSHPNVRAFIETAKRHLRESSLQTVQLHSLEHEFQTATVRMRFQVLPIRSGC